VIVAFAAATVVLGLLLGASGYNDMFKGHNPQLYWQLRRAFSIC
jgi:hypothetical protein